MGYKYYYHFDVTQCIVWLVLLLITVFSNWKFDQIFSRSKLDAKGTKRSLKMLATNFIWVFSKMICCTWTAGRQIFHYIRKEWGKFWFLRVFVITSEKPNWFLYLSFFLGLPFLSWHWKGEVKRARNRLEKEDYDKGRTDFLLASYQHRKGQTKVGQTNFLKTFFSEPFQSNIPHFELFLEWFEMGFMLRQCVP